LSVSSARVPCAEETSYPFCLQCIIFFIFFCALLHIANFLKSAIIIIVKGERREYEAKSRKTSREGDIINEPRAVKVFLKKIRKPLDIFSEV